MEAETRARRLRKWLGSSGREEAGVDRGGGVRSGNPAREGRETKTGMCAGDASKLVLIKERKRVGGAHIQPQARFFARAPLHGGLGEARRFNAPVTDRWGGGRRGARVSVWRGRPEAAARVGVGGAYRRRLAPGKSDWHVGPMCLRGRHQWCGRLLGRGWGRGFTSS